MTLPLDYGCPYTTLHPRISLNLLLTLRIHKVRFPGGAVVLRHCIAVLAVPPEILGSTPGSVVGHCTIGPVSSRLGRAWLAGALATPVVGWAQCTLTGSPGVWCFLRHIGAAGFRVGCALCQEAVRLGWVVFRRTHGSRPSPLPSPYVSCSDETRL
jgi:hypothetical protein